MSIRIEADTAVTPGVITGSTPTLKNDRGWAFVLRSDGGFWAQKKGGTKKAPEPWWLYEASTGGTWRKLDQAPTTIDTKLSAQQLDAAKAGASLFRGKWTGKVGWALSASRSGTPADIRIELRRRISSYAVVVVTLNRGEGWRWTVEPANPKKMPAWWKAEGAVTGAAETYPAATVGGVRAAQAAVIGPSCALRDTQPRSPAAGGAAAPKVPKGAPPGEWIYDSTGRRFKVVSTFVDAKTDGSGPVVPSNLPAGGKAPGFPAILQARDLDSTGERFKIRAIAADLDPSRLLLPHADPTLGAPVVWEEAKTGRMYPLGGNGRTIALLSAPEDRWKAYQEEAKARYPRLYPKKPAPPGTRRILIRKVYAADGAPLSLEEAAQLAGASQASTAGVESPLGRAASLARSLGLRDPSDLGRWQWIKRLDRDTIKAAQNENRAWFRALLGKLPKDKRVGYESEPAALVELTRAVFAAALPPELVRLGLGTEGQEAALLGSLSGLWTIHDDVTAGAAAPAWDLWPQLAPAAEASRAWRSMSAEDAVRQVEEAADQVGLFGGRSRSVVDDLAPLGVALALALKKAAATKDPEGTMERYLRAYRGCAGPECDADIAGKGALSDQPPALGLVPYQPLDPASVLAGIIGVRLPKKAPKA